MKLTLAIIVVSVLSLCNFGSQSGGGASNQPGGVTNATGEAGRSTQNVNAPNNESAGSEAGDETTSGESQTDRERERIARELIALKRRWIEAIRTVDRRTMDLILADEFVNVTSQGMRDTKAHFMDPRGIPSPDPLSVVIEQPRLTSYGGNRAVMVYIVSITGGDTNLRSRDTDTFIRRNGRWQFLSSISSRVENDS